MSSSEVPASSTVLEKRRDCAIHQPIELNQDNELIDGWHRILEAKKVDREQIHYVVVETDSEDDLLDRMYAANLRHGVQYSREQERAYGIALRGQVLIAKKITKLPGVGVSTVYR